MLDGARGTIVAMGASSAVQALGNIEAGMDGLDVQATIGTYDGGVVGTNSSALLRGGTTLKGDSEFAAVSSIVASDDVIAIAPGGIDDLPATLTFATPSYTAGASTTLLIDAIRDGSGIMENDHLHVTGSATLDGIVDLNLGFNDPDPWMKNGSAGDWFHVLSANGSLLESIGASFPPIDSLNLPEGYHFEWRVVYDRNDGTPFQELVDLNASFSSQPWLANGTKDVVLIIVEVPPQGMPDIYETPVDPPLSVPPSGGVMTNDPPPPGSETPTAILVTGTIYGDLTLNPDGSFEYDPDSLPPGMCSRPDTFTYKVVAGLSESDPTLVTINVHAPPTANDNAHNDGQTRWIDEANPGILGNDSCSPQSAVLVSDVSYGSLTFVGDGGFEYTPDTNFYGDDSFTYKAVRDGQESNVATVTLTVMPPTVIAMDNQFWSFMGASVNESAISDDTNATEAEYVASSGPSVGSFSFNESNGTFSYTPPSGFTGSVSFQYIAIHGPSGAQDGPATVTIHCDAMLLPLQLDQAAGPGAAVLGLEQLVPIGRAAVERWRGAGVDDATLDARLANLHFVIADLPGSYLGGASAGGTVVIDVDGAGFGWFIDATPGDDLEFSTWTTASEAHALDGTPAAGRADLLTVVMHEIGHLLGLDDLSDSGDGNIMTGTIGLGTRRIPTDLDAAMVDFLFQQWQAEQED
jgi:hypothetical protein